MPRIAILSASVRQGRRSHRAALYLQHTLDALPDLTVDLIDLNSYSFPLFEERLKFQQDPSPAVREFAHRIAQADGVIIVTPEYNGGYPASLERGDGKILTLFYGKEGETYAARAAIWAVPE